MNRGQSPVITNNQTISKPLTEDAMREGAPSKVDDLEEGMRVGRVELQFRGVLSEEKDLDRRSRSV
jgi:hypothetical protein